MAGDQANPLIRVKALGYLELEDRHGRSITPMLKRPKQVALFAVVAIGEGAIRSRDRLMGMFWPDSTSERARHSFAQILYQIRQDLGAGVIHRHGDQLVVDPEVVWCDVVAFQAAVKEGDHRQAAALYRGDLLDGLFLSDAPEFEHWVDGLRTRLRRDAVRSLWAVADELRASGDIPGATDFARRAAALAPDDEASLRRLLVFLDGVGDRAGALGVYEEFAERLRREYEADPAPETFALIDAIRARVGAADGAVPPLEAPGSAPWTAPDEVERPVAATSPGSAARTIPVRPARRLPRSLIAGAAIAAVLVLWVFWPAGAAAPANSVVVLSGRAIPVGDPGAAAPDIAARTAQALSAELAAVTGLTVVSDAAAEGVALRDLGAELGVGAVVAVDAWRDTRGLRVTAQVVDPTSGAIVAMQSFSDTALSALTRFARQRLGDLERSRRLGVEAPRPEALEKLVEADWLTDEGLRHRTERRPELAISYLLEADSVLAVAEELAPRWSEPSLRRGWAAMERALAVTNRSDLPGQTTDSLAFAVLDEAEAHAERALRRDPGSPFGLELRGSVRLLRWQGMVHADDSLAVASEADLAEAVAQNPTLSGVWSRLTQLRAARGDVGGALIAVQRAMQADSHLEHDLTTRSDLLGFAAFAGDRTVGERACAEGMADFPEDRVFAECRLFLMSWIPELADPVQARREFANLDRERGDFQSSRALRLLWLAGAMANARQPDSARAALDAWRSLTPGPDSMAAYVEEIRVLSLLGDPDGATNRLSALIRRTPAAGTLVPNDPRFRRLRGTPAFDDLADSLRITGP